ncbi:MAG: trypsin-like serine protease [Nannocystaceae bacterium]|nr:trypsin-like serine protease [Myxococcales bacterium]
MLVIAALVAAAGLTPDLTAPPPEPAQIIGGERVPGEWSSVVAVVSVDALHPGALYQEVSLCSGVLLDARTVLTAAHCLVEIDSVDSMAVVFGDTIHTSDERFVAPVASFAVHPDYCGDDDCEGDAFDFGLVTIDANIGGVELIAPLVDQDEWDATMIPGQKLTVVGFGAIHETSEGESLSEDEVGDKREVSLQIQKLSDTGLEFVAGNDGKDVCGGDSGGPAFLKAPDGSWRLAGIVSRGVPPCGTGQGYYGTVYGALDWVRDTVGLDLLPVGCDGDCLDTTPAKEDSGCRVGARTTTLPGLLVLPIGLLLGGWLRHRRRFG